MTTFRAVVWMLVLTIPCIAGCSADTSREADDAGQSEVLDVPNAGDDGTTQDTAIPPEDTALPDTSNDVVDVAPDADNDTSDTTPSNVTLADYIPCTSNNDCPVGFGDCITDVPLSKPVADGTTAISVLDLTDGASPGICTLACTNSNPCSTLTLEDADGYDVPYVCQLIASESPYPGFPVAMDADTHAAMTTGEAYAAVCRPPFELDPSVEDSFCDSCDDSAACGSGICWSFLTETEAATSNPGICLAPCADDGACPIGFSCEALQTGGTELGSYCAPVGRTCSDCRDLDGDMRGAGRCTGIGSAPVSSVDCDDTNAVAYYDANNMLHAFPTHCGAHDYNCNGLSDDGEEVGVAPFWDAHCSRCDDPCTGPAVGGQWNCTWLGDTTACVIDCPDAVDCNNDTSDGCEVPKSNTDYWVYADDDEDGAGTSDTNAVHAFSCTAVTAPPPGWAANQADCDDGDNTVYGAGSPSGLAPELCDGKDNDCDPSTDDGTGMAWLGAACDGGDTCPDLGGVYECTGGVQVCTEDPNDDAEVCNGVDDDCDTATVDGADEAPPPGTCAFDCVTDADCESLDIGTLECDTTVGTCVVPADAVESECFKSRTYACLGASGWGCVGGAPLTTETAPDDGKDDDCDGYDFAAANAVYIAVNPPSPPSGTTAGLSAAYPIDNFRGGLQLARLRGRSVIVAEAGDYATLESFPLELTTGMYLIGGFAAEYRKHPDASNSTFRRSGTLRGGEVVGISVVDETDVTVDSMRVVTSAISTPAATGMSGADNIGLRFRNANGLTLRNVELVAGAGQNGGVGISPGAVAVCTDPKGRTGGTCVDTVSGGSGGDGGYWDCPVGGGDCTKVAAGSGADGPGSPGTGGQAHPVAGQRGGDGTTPTVAALGGSPGSLDPSTGLWVQELGATGLSGGGGGGGSGGALLSFECAYSTIFPCACCQEYGGGGGAGGPGGPGGGGGGGGGASIGIFGWATSNLTFEEVTATAGSGGVGGAGGTGADGGVFTFGASGDSGALGGFGGFGGAGGGGGGGAGGSSIGYLHGSINTTQSSSQPNAFQGTPGAGGSGGSGGTIDSKDAPAGEVGASGEAATTKSTN